MAVLILFDSPLKCCNMGVSKQLSDDLKTKIIQHAGLGECSQKLSKRFQLTISTVPRSTGPLGRNGRPWAQFLIGPENTERQRQRQRRIGMVRNNPQITSKDLQGYLAADGLTVHRSTIPRKLPKERLYGRVMHKKPFLHTRHKLGHLSYAKTYLDKPISFLEWDSVDWWDKKRIVQSQQEAICMAAKEHRIPWKNACFQK